MGDFWAISGRFLGDELRENPLRWFGSDQFRFILLQRVTFPSHTRLTLS